MKILTNTRLLFLTVLTAVNLSASGQWPLPVIHDTRGNERFISRTMDLLNGGSLKGKREVRILVYGQSISAQDWWLEVKRYVTGRFPAADIVMKNLAVGGFSTEYLFKTIEMDMGSFYPDLVLLHIYGGAENYEKVLKTIRGRTAAEVAMMTDHYTGPNKWSDTMSYHILPALASKYHCALVNIRDPWKEYLEANKLKPEALLTDGIHLNDHGNFLMAELIKPLFNLPAAAETDPDSLEREYVYGKDISFTGDTLKLNFTGNRADLTLFTGQLQPDDSMQILLDGVPPSSFEGTYFMTRPYSTNGKEWPWDLPAMIRVEHSVPWAEEEWKLVYTSARAPYTDFRFVVYGSVTGRDGKGRGSRDFNSVSGRVLIRGGDATEGGDWHLNRSYKILGTTVGRGDTIKWRTHSISSNYAGTGSEVLKRGERTVILFQGVPAGDHTLSIIKRRGSDSCIRGIRTYRPLLYR